MLIHWSATQRDVSRRKRPFIDPYPKWTNRGPTQLLSFPVGFTSNKVYAQNRFKCCGVPSLSFTTELAQDTSLKLGCINWVQGDGVFKKVKPSRPRTTLYEWLPTCLALSGQVGVPLEHIAHFQNPTNWSSNFQSAASASPVYFRAALLFLYISQMGPHLTLCNCSQ